MSTAALPKYDQSLFNSITRMTNAATQATQYPQTQCSIVLPFLLGNVFEPTRLKTARLLPAVKPIIFRSDDG